MSNKYWISIVVRLFLCGRYENYVEFSWMCTFGAALIVVEWPELKGVVVIVCVFFCYSFEFTFATRQGLQLHRVCVFGSNLQDMPKFKVQNPFVAWRILHHTQFQAMNCFLPSFSSSEQNRTESSQRGRKCVWVRALHLVSRLYSVNTSLKIVTVHTFPMTNRWHIFCSVSLSRSLAHSFDWHFSKIKI